MSKTYAKLSEQGDLIALNYIPGVTNPTEETRERYATSHGYYPVIYTDSPGDWYSPAFTQEVSCIRQTWTEWDNEAKISAIQSNVQNNLNSKAAERNYDDIFTAISYEGSKNPKFAAEAAALKDWRDATWTACYEYLAKVEAGEITIPDNWQAVEAVLPKFDWPVL